MNTPGDFDPSKFNVDDKSADRGDILDYFPPGRIPRENQRDILKKYEELSKSNKKIIICEPVGSGKTFEAFTILNSLSNGFMVTATKALQDQARRDFLTLADIRGKTEFKCPQQIRTKPQSFIDKLRNINDYRRAGLTSNFGLCSWKKNGKQVFCPHIDPVYGDVDESNKPYERCGYKDQMRYGLAADITLTNYAMYFTLLRLGVKGINRMQGVYDEAHTIPDQIVNNIGTDITQKQLQVCELDANNFKLTEFEEVTKLLLAMCNEYDHILVCKENDKKAYPKLNEEKISKRKEKIGTLHSDMKNDPDNFSFYYDVLKKILTIKPINLSPFSKMFFKSNTQTFFSGTIDIQQFTKNLGFDPEEFAIIENKTSNIPARNRPVNFLNVVSRSKRFINKVNTAKMDKAIIDILTKHQNERGLIQTNSIERCHDISNALSTTDHKNRTMIIHSNNDDGSTIQELLKKHTETPGSIIISSSFWMGYDLKDDLATFQIIEKFPRMYFRDPWVTKKIYQDRNWYNHHAITKLLQGIGRIVRHENDYGITYCLDSDIESSLNRNRFMVPKAFHDALWPEEVKKEEFFWS